VAPHVGSDLAKAMEFSALSPWLPFRWQTQRVEEGALADLLLFDGEPITNINMVQDADENLLGIMKDGNLYKNIVAGKN
jgi:hypothetical protein